MLFRNKAEQPKPSPPSKVSLEWADTSRRNQECRVMVTNWNFQVSPMLGDNGFGKIGLDFEGNAKINRSTDIKVYAGIEVLDHGDELGRLKDYWKTVPEHVEGHGTYDEPYDVGGVSSLHLTLLCRPAAVDWLYRAFMCGFSQLGRLAVDIKLSYPDPMGNDFWKDRWRGEQLRVTEWGVLTSADRKLENS